MINFLNSAIQFSINLYYNILHYNFGKIFPNKMYVPGKFWVPNIFCTPALIYKKNHFIIRYFFLSFEYFLIFSFSEGEKIMLINKSNFHFILFPPPFLSFCQLGNSTIILSLLPENFRAIQPSCQLILSPLFYNRFMQES